MPPLPNVLTYSKTKLNNQEAQAAEKRDQVQQKREESQCPTEFGFHPALNGKPLSTESKTHRTQLLEQQQGAQVYNS